MLALADEPRRRARRRLVLAVAGVAVAAVLTLWVAPRRLVRTAPDFAESIVIVGDHTCIWLEPVAAAATGENFHD